MGLELVPIELDESNAFVEAHHRHNAPVVRDRFRVAAALDGEVVGVANVGRPLARHLQDGWTVEVLRCCTIGERNACSLLYGACWRAAKALGYRRLVTYTLATEPGSSLRAVGFRVVAEVPAGSWSRRDRPRVDTHPLQERLRWELSS